MRENRSINMFLVRQALELKGDKEITMPTHKDSNSFYECGTDLALGLGRATSIETIYKIDTFTIAAIKTITDNWNHDEDEANKGGTFLKDAYVVQQSGLRQNYAFKTTYDVTFSLAELYGVK